MSSYVSPEHDSRFAERLRERCAAALARSTDFAVLVESLEGADPLVALDTLRGLSEAGSELAELAARAQRQALDADCRPPSSTLPIVHPLDYHWRFTAATVEHLLGIAAENSSPGESVLFLGTPSLFAAAAGLLADRRCVLLDRDQRVVDALGLDGHGEAHVVDLLLGPLPDLQANVCVCDPPWYPDAIAGFTGAGARMLAEGGLLLLSFPAELTRPAVDVERGAYLQGLGEDGLASVGHEALACRYETPPFEYAAMAAAGLSCPPPDWRRGDLLSLRRAGPLPEPRPNAEESQWAGFLVDQIPLRVRVSSPAVGSELLGSLVPGDVLPSVSRRVPVRDQVALWSSRNRIFSSSDPERLAATLAKLAAGEELPTGVEAQVGDQLIDLVRRERREHGLLRVGMTAGPGR